MCLLMQTASWSPCASSPLCGSCCGLVYECMWPGGEVGTLERSLPKSCGLGWNLKARMQAFTSKCPVSIHQPLRQSMDRWECHHSVSSVQFSRSVVSDSLRPHELQHARPPCLSPTPGVYPNSWPLRRWCHPAISSSVIPFFSCPQSLPASGSFPMSQLFTSGGQSIGVSASVSVLPMNTQDWSPLGWTGWIFLQSKGPSRVFSNITVQNNQFFGAQLSSQSNSHIHAWPLEKP